MSRKPPTHAEHVDEGAPRVPSKLAREWAAKLRDSGFRDLEYSDGSLLGISIQEPDRAPHDLESTREYFSRAAEYLHAHRWGKRTADKRIWTRHAEGESMRDIGAALDMPLTTVHRAVERLRADCEAWWRDTAEERANPPPERGRPRKEHPRREQLLVRLTRDELLAVRSAAHRAGCVRSHEVGAWIRWALLSSAERVPYELAKTG
jgi:hypothetical protein